MDSHNFSSETSSVFVVQESTSDDEIKHKFEVCAENSIINLDNNDGLKENENKTVVNSSEPINNYNVVIDHSYGSIDEKTDVTEKKESVACKSGSEFKKDSLNESGEINVTLTVHDNLICSIEEGSILTEEVNRSDTSVTTDIHGMKESTIPAKTASGNLENDANKVNSENLQVQSIITANPTEKVFKPIYITSVKSLKITKPDNSFDRNKPNLKALFCNQGFKSFSLDCEDFSSFNRTNRRSEAWNHFTQLNLQETECNYCKKKFSAHSGSSNLLRHLRSQHENDMKFDKKSKSNAEDRTNDSSKDDENVVSAQKSGENKGKKISKVWKYFSKSKLGKVKCKICFKIIPYRNSNSLLLRHLRLNHLYIYNCNIRNFLKSGKKINELRNYKELCKNVMDSSDRKINQSPSSLHKITDGKSIKKKRKLSESWKYFTTLQSDKIKCNICNRTLKFMEGVSSNLTRHLKMSHKDLYSKNNYCEKIEPTINNHLDQKFDIDSVNSNNILDRENNDNDDGDIDDDDDGDDKNVTKIRKYFSKFNSGKVKCNLCHVTLTHTPGLTFNLKCHIILKHKNIFEKIVKAIYAEENKNLATDDSEREKEYKKIKINWKYFTRMKSGKLKCNLCTEIPSFYCNVSDSLQHLNLIHNITLESDEEQSIVSLIEFHESKLQLVDKSSHTDDFTVKDSEKTASKNSLEIIKTDRTWKFFSKIYHGKLIEVKCNLCDDIFSYSRGVTSNLTAHLNMVHKNEKLESECINYRKFEQVDFSQPEKTPIKKDSSCKRNSRTWHYFAMTEKNKAKCSICLKELAFTPRSISNLTRHLKRKHHNDFNITNCVEPPYAEVEQIKTEFQCTSIEGSIEDDNSLEIHSIFELLKNDEKLKNCIKLESEIITCKLCSETFLCQNINDYLFLLQEHMQINHAQWKVVCDENVKKIMATDPTSANYNELVAIANEIQSYALINNTPSISNEKDSVPILNNDLNDSQNELYKNIWKYFTRLTSQNVRCNFCCALLSFKNNKKWNLYRHLRSKHKSKLDENDLFKGRKSDKEVLHSSENTSPQKKHPSSMVKSESQQKEKVKFDVSHLLPEKDDSSDESNDSDEQVEGNCGKSIFISRTGRTWSHFTKVEMGKATCNTCHKIIKYTGTGLDILNEHLNENHFRKSTASKRFKSRRIRPKLPVSYDQKSKLRSNTRTSRRKSSLRSSSHKSFKDNYKQIGLIDLLKSTTTDKIQINTSKNCNINYENNENNDDSDQHSKKSGITHLNEKNSQETGTVFKSISDDVSSFIKTRSKVWTYFTNDGKGFAKCHLCLMLIKFRAKEVNLIRHLKRVHSVVSVCNQKSERFTTFNEEKEDKSQLLAAVDLTPKKSLINKKHVCFTKLGKNMAKCNFCSQDILHEDGETHKLIAHLLNIHSNEVISCNNLMLKHVKIFENDDDITISSNDLQFSAFNQLKSGFDSSDPHFMPNKKRSNTWLYYTKLNDDHAQCNICSRALSFKGGSVYNLTRHLFIKHKIKFNRDAVHYKQKTDDPDIKVIPKIFNICKKKSSILSFYAKINRYLVKCKLCCKRFIYKGVNVNRLVKHLWSNHIARLIEFNSSRSCVMSNAKIIKKNSEPSVEHSNKNVVEKNYQSVCSDSSKSEPRRKISSSWKYFTKKSNEGFRAKCNICFRYFSFKNGNISNLSRHLFKNHGIKLIKTNFDKEGNEREIESGISNINSVNTSSSSLVKASGDSGVKHLADAGIKEYRRTNLTSEKEHASKVWNFMKMTDAGVVECNICKEKFSFEDCKISDGALQSHLFNAHGIKILLFKQQLSGTTNDSYPCLISKPFSDVNDRMVTSQLMSCSDKNNKNKRLKRSFCRMKCKLCYRQLIFKENKTELLFKHLIIHKKELSEDENLILNKIQNSELKFNEKAGKNVPSSDCKVGISDSFIYKHFKNLNISTNKCNMCHKFVSSKIYCSHHVGTDLSITYRLKRSRSHKAVESSSKIFKEGDDSVKSPRQRCMTVSPIEKNMNYFMSVNSCENKCGLCNLSLENKGYCSHSINQWFSENQQEKTENKSELENDIRANDELEIITDALNDGENKIIIITDDGAPLLNYEGNNKNESESDDVSYHVIDMDGENNDDIQVVIYNFDAEEGENFTEQQTDSIDNEKLKNSASIIQGCDKELEEQVKVILQELNNANIFSNQGQRKCNLVKNEDKLSFVEKSAVNQQSEVIETREEIFSLEKSLKHPFNKSKVEVQPIPNSETHYEDFKNKQPVNNALVLNHECEVSFESGHELKNMNDESVEKKQSFEELSHEGNEESNHVMEPANQNNGFEALMKVSDANDSQTVNTFSKNIEENFEEAIVNIEESMEEFSSIDPFIYKNDSFEIKSGIYLQSLNGLHKISKILIHFSSISYFYNSAKCNICNKNLLFNGPLIHNLMSHLYLKHKNINIPDGTLGVTHDKKGIKILDLLDDRDENDDYVMEPIFKPRRTSPVWKYFINDDNYRATCKICHFNFSYKGGAVNNLGRHLRLRHNVHISAKNDKNIENYEVNINELKELQMLPKKRTACKLRSKTWNYFSKEPNDWAKCILCKRYLSYRSSTINNLTRHLRTVHADIYNRLFSDGGFSLNETNKNIEVMKDEIFKNVLLETSTSRSRDEVLQECSYSLSEQSGTKRTSVVWNYFTEVNRDSGRCNFCSKIISCKGGGTSNLSRHLRVKHGIWIVMTNTLTNSYEEEFLNDHAESNEAGSFLNQSSDPSITTNDKIITHEELQILKNKKPISKKSKTWDFFVKETPERVVCKICSKALSYKCKAVHNLRRHLVVKHPNCLGNREPVRLKLEIDNEKESVTYEGQNETSVADKTYIDITNTSVVIVDEENPLPTRKADRSARPKKSFVWNYFDELEYGVAKCNMCSKVLSFRGGGTNNLMRHLRSQHSIIVDIQLAEEVGCPTTVDDIDPTNVELVRFDSDSGTFILGN